MAGAAPPASDRSQRSRILATALGLMAQHGADGVSMRRLAAECGLNVATLYHYFPSKADLLRSVIEERQYATLMRESLPVDRTSPPRDRLVDLLMLIWTEALHEEDVWRLLLGESLRSDEVALRVAGLLASELHDALDRWLADLFPELSERRPAVATVITGQSLGIFLEYLLVPPAARTAAARRRAEDLADLIFP
ncbi:MAG TPA: helix-turn-helix domain-containing protein [Acidimicrobiales bacterium]|jgi:AcrR family transcriptional regulator